MRRFAIKYYLSSTVLILSLVFLPSCASFSPTRQPSLFDTYAELLRKQYSHDEIRRIEQGFETNQSLNSQQLGNLILWQMYQKSPEFALEFAQTPELNDSIDEKEARAMMAIYNLIKDLDIPPDLFEDKAEYKAGIFKIILEWRGDKKEKVSWNGWFPHSNILSVEPLGFEKGEDYINFVKENNTGSLDWQSFANKEDSDGLIVALKVPNHYDKLTLNISTKPIFFNRSDLVAKNQLSFNEKHGLEGTLIIKNASETNLPPELYALRDMVLAGENDYRFSAPLQALLWGYMDSYFKEGNNPFENYIDFVEFVKPVWGDMKGPRWEDFDTVVKRLNDPQLILRFAQDNLSYDFESLKTILKFGTVRWKTPKQTFALKKGNCNDQGRFALHCLLRNGYTYDNFDKSESAAVCLRAYVSRYKPGVGHVTCLYKDKSEYFYIINLGKMCAPYTIEGPFKSIEEAASATYKGWKEYYFFDTYNHITFKR